MIKNYFGKLITVCFIFALTSCDVFPESMFNLSGESRLPRWFQIPSGMSRTDVSVKMSYHSEKTIFELKDKSDNTLKKIIGRRATNFPIYLDKQKSTKNDIYPSYELIMVDEISEIIEHRKLEPFFYIVDDADVIAEILKKHKIVKFNK